MRKQFAKTLIELGRDEKLVILIGDISHFLLQSFQNQYPDRFYNLGIAEQSMMSLSSGLAMHGFYPVVHSITPFIIERAFEQIKDDICYQGLGVNIVSVGSAFDYASLGCTHHCYDDIAILRTLPGMQIIYPGAPHEFDSLFRETYSNGSPTYFRLPQKIHNLKTNPKFGEAELLLRGNNATIIAIGPQIQNAYDAATELSLKDIYCDVFYISTIKPILKESREIIRKSILKTGKLLTIEEHSIRGGIGDEIALLCGDISFFHKRMGIDDKFLVNYGDYDEHCLENKLTKEGIKESIYEIL